MSKRRSLDDDLYGDRALIRGHRVSLLNDDFSTSVSTYGSGFVSDRGYWGSKLSKTSHKRCYHDHPPLKLPNSDKVIYGGSCSSPVVKDADVYIGFDFSMKFSQRHWPWKKGHEIQFEVRDMGVPTDVANYRKLLEWTKRQLEAGAKVHAGCIGGHGRTGMFLAALVSLYGEPDAINYVRQNYCKKAVESLEQVKFLNREFGIIPADGTKTLAPVKQVLEASVKPKAKSKKSSSPSGTKQVFQPLPGGKGIWG